MTRIGLISDTHSYMDDRIIHHLSGVDEIWHAGDIGNAAVSDALMAIKPYRAVYGNIDGGELRRMHKANLYFRVDGVTVWMTHIGGRPPRYAKGIKEELNRIRPNLFICGHSHILKVQKDHAQGGVLYMNPGAAGIHGFHKMRTLLRFNLHEGKIQDLEVVELGPRARTTEV